MTSLTLTGFSLAIPSAIVSPASKDVATPPASCHTQRRAICGLRTEYSWHPVNLARSDQFLKPEIQANYIASVTKRHNNVVRNGKAALFPNLKSQSLGAFDEIRLPIVACVEGSWEAAKAASATVCRVPSTAFHVRTHRRTRVFLAFGARAGTRMRAVNPKAAA